MTPTKSMNCSHEYLALVIIPYEMNLSKFKKKMYTIAFLQFKKEMYNILERNVHFKILRRKCT